MDTIHTMKSMVNQRIHIAPVGFEIDRIVVLPLSMGWFEQDPLTANLAITFVYASVSFARSYFLRRVFEKFGIDDNFIRLGKKGILRLVKGVRR